MSLMRRFRPLHAVLVVALLMAATLAAQRFLARDRAATTRVGPDARGEVRIDIAGLVPSTVRFYRFLNAGNQEVRFFLGRDPAGRLVAAFDASENDFKRHRGFRHEGEWMVNNKCDTATRLAEINEGRSGCAPAPLAHRLEGTQVVLSENDLLTGWRFFR
jgi:uncharacterized membrane protein